MRGNPTFSGPRLVSPVSSEPEPEDEDPAHGSAVPRCRICGLPDQPTNHLIEGVWVRGAFSMAVVLCERELPPLDPRAGDPLTIVMAG